MAKPTLASHLNRIDDRLLNIETTLARQTAHLEDHLRRTGVIEEAIPPLFTHVRRVEGGAKVLLILGTAFGSLIAIIKGFF